MFGLTLVAILAKPCEINLCNFFLHSCRSEVYNDESKGQSVCLLLTTCLFLLGDVMFIHWKTNYNVLHFIIQLDFFFSEFYIWCNGPRLAMLNIIVPWFLHLIVFTDCPDACSEWESNIVLICLSSWSEDRSCLWGWRPVTSRHRASWRFILAGTVLKHSRVHLNYIRKTTDKSYR